MVIDVNIRGSLKQLGDALINKINVGAENTFNQIGQLKEIGRF
jgi:hypothetical protein